MLARWFRPVVVSLATLALVATLGIQWAEQSHDASAAAMDTLTSTQTVDISVGGDSSVSSNTRAAAVVVVIVAFLAGILVGVAGDPLYLIRSGRLIPRHTSRFAADRMAERLSRELDSPRSRKRKSNKSSNATARKSTQRWGTSARKSARSSTRQTRRSRKCSRPSRRRSSQICGCGSERRRDRGSARQ